MNQWTRQRRNGFQALPVSNHPSTQFLDTRSANRLSFLDGAGVDTILAVMARFVFNMMIHPEIQRRAQEEIDALTGGHRLPTLEECAFML